MKTIDIKTKERILSLLRAHGSIKSVAKTAGVGTMTVSRLKRSFLPTLSNQASGRPCILSDITLHRISRNVLKGECTTGKDVHKRLQQEGIQISYQTTLNSLRRIRINPRKKTKKPFLSKKHKQERLNGQGHTNTGQLMTGGASSSQTKPRSTSGTPMASSTA